MEELIKKIDEELTQIKADLADESKTLDLDATEARSKELLEERAKLVIKLNEEKREQARRAVGNGAGIVIDSVKEEENMEKKTLGIDSKEYRVAFFKHLKGMELTEAEQRVMNTGLTENQSILVPTETQNNIWDLVFGEHCILADCNTLRANSVVEIITHSESSGATQVAEGVAPSEETNTFAKITLSGKDYAKYVDITYAMQNMAIPALISYIESEIAKAIGEAMAKDAVTAIESKIDAENKVTASKAVSYTDVAKAFGTLKRVGNVAIYATRYSVYNYLIGMTDTNGQPILQAPAAGAPLGSIFGAPIKIEDAVADGKILIGDASKATNAVVSDIMIESDKDIKKHVTTYSGYARAEVALTDPKAFAEITLGE